MRFAQLLISYTLRDSQFAKLIVPNQLPSHQLNPCPPPTKINQWQDSEANVQSHFCEFDQALLEFKRDKTLRVRPSALQFENETNPRTARLIRQPMLAIGRESAIAGLR